MQKREKILAGVLAGAVAFWFGGSFITSVFIEPLKQLEGEESHLTNERRRLVDEQMALARKENQLRLWRALSLPPDPLDAQRLYQEWLVTLANMSGFEISKVTLERRVQERDTYVTIPVTIEAKAQLQELAGFLARFQSVKLLHRIARCDITSPSSEGNPELTVVLTAEGVSMTSAPPRTRLFPLTELTGAVSRDAQTITVGTSKGFPEQTPFCVRIGGEFMNVTEVKDNVWTVQRGVEKSFAEKHASGATVEEFPIQAGKDATKSIAAMWTRSIFTKPTQQIDYRPRLATTTAPVAIRGSSWKWKLEVTGWNPAFGSPKFELLSGPSGLELDEKTGTLNWNVGSQAEPGMQTAEILVWGTNGRNSGFTPTVNIRVRDPNLPPRFEEMKPLTFYIGRETKVRVPAIDPDGDANMMTYSLLEGPPGMTIDSKTGELKWAPGDELAPQDYKVRLEAKDSDEMPQTASAELTVSLLEDSAKFTYLTGYLKRTSGVEEFLVIDRATNRNSLVRKGDRLQVADFDLTIEEIFPTYLVVRRDGKLYTWTFEQPLTAIEPLEGPENAVPVAAPGTPDPSE